MCIPFKYCRFIRAKPKGIAIMGNAFDITEIAKVEEEKTGGLETPRTATNRGSDSSSPVDIVSKTSLVLASTVPIEFYPLLDEAIVTCEKHGRIDIIITYLCNLQATSKEVGEIARGLKHIAHLQHNITTTFVPIRY